MNLSTRTLLAGTIALGLSSASFGQISSYNEDFESLDITSTTCLGDAGWLVFGNVFDGGGNYLYGYGPFPAPNTGLAFSGVTTNEGGPDQGAQQLVTYSDYQNADHNNGFLIESNVFQEQIVGSGDVGKTFTFQFDGKLGDIGGNSTSLAFIKVIDSATFALDAYVTLDTTNLPITWGTYFLDLTITTDFVGDYLQIGFSNVCTNYENSGMIYDNVFLYEAGGTCGTKYCGSDQNANNSALIDIDSCDSSSASINVTLTNGPANQFIYLLVGNGSSTVSQPPGAKGDLCVVGGDCLGRYDKDVGQIDSTGSFSTDILNAVSTPCAGAVNIAPGATWNFQYWHRQPMGAPATFSEAIAVTFQ